MKLWQKLTLLVVILTLLFQEAMSKVKAKKPEPKVEKRKPKKAPEP